jgi:molecular chaperone Hsp33
MEPDTTEDLAVVQCLRHPSHDAILSTGDFTHLFEAYLLHVAQWESIPDGLALVMIRQGLAAATLHLSCRPRDEMTAWTLNIKEPPLNIFLTGDNSRSIITGRVFTKDVRTAAQSRLFSESCRANRKPVQSVIDVAGLDVLDIFEQYYASSEQIPARLFELSDTEFALVQGLPNVDTGWIKGLEREEIRGLLDQAKDLEKIVERRFHFLCGCDLPTILRAISSIYKKDNLEELFMGDERVEVFCPRCGKRWWVSRQDFKASPPKLGIS